MTEFDFPKTEEPITTALRQAIDYILERFDNVVGIIAAGSILRGEGDAHSDVDTYIIIEGNYRQRVQKFFNGVRFELFVNAPDYIRQYIKEEPEDGVAAAAHMLTTGHVILNRSAIVDELIQVAQASIDAGPQYQQKTLTTQRYFMADRLENGFDLRQRDPMMGLILIDSTLMGMLVYQFQKQGKWVPRQKDLLKKLRVDEPELAQLVEQYYAAHGDKRFDIAALIADYTLGVRGFFEWESDKDYLA